MFNYDVFAIGNALLDTEIKVSDDFLKKNKINKGVMTLIDDNKRKELIDSFCNLKKYYNCGGSAANTVVTMSQLGAKVFYCFKVSSDESGDCYRKELEQNKITYSKEKSISQTGETGQVFVMITPDADRSMNTYLGISADLSVDDISFDDLEKSKWLYIEGYVLSQRKGVDASLKAIEIARETNCKIALTLSDPSLISIFRDHFKEVIDKSKRLDMLFCNKYELFEFTQTQNIDEAISNCLSIASSFAITKGAEGATVYDGSKFYEVDAPKVNAIDTNGAGDIFAGVFLQSIISKRDYETAATMACKVASFLVGRQGTRLNKNTLADILKDYL